MYGIDDRNYFSGPQFGYKNKHFLQMDTAKNKA